MGEARAVLNRDARPASKVRLFSRANSGRSGLAGSTDNAAPTCRFAKRNTLALAISSIAGCDPEGSGGMVRKKALVARNAGRLSNTRGTAGAGMTESAHKMFGQASSQPAPGSTAADVRAVAAHIAVRIADAAVDDLRARYDLGQLVHYLRYGRSQPPALDALARSLGMHPSALRRYGRVTERIRVQEFASLLQRRDVYGR